MNHSKDSLALLSFPEIKAIALEADVFPEKNRSYKQNWINAILGIKSTKTMTDHCSSDNHPKPSSQSDKLQSSPLFVAMAIMIIVTVAIQSMLTITAWVIRKSHERACLATIEEAKKLNTSLNLYGSSM